MSRVCDGNQWKALLGEIMIHHHSYDHDGDDRPWCWTSSSSGLHQAGAQCHHRHQWLGSPRCYPLHGHNHHHHHYHHHHCRRCRSHHQQLSFLIWFLGEPRWTRVCSSSATVWEWWCCCHSPACQWEVSLGHSCKVRMDCRFICQGIFSLVL